MQKEVTLFDPIHRKFKKWIALWKMRKRFFSGGIVIKKPRASALVNTQFSALRAGVPSCVQLVMTHQTHTLVICMLLCCMQCLHERFPFLNYSFDEMANYDLPASVNFILNKMTKNNCIMWVILKTATIVYSNGRLIKCLIQILCLPLK